MGRPSADQGTIWRPAADRRRDARGPGAGSDERVRRSITPSASGSSARPGRKQCSRQRQRGGSSRPSSRVEPAWEAESCSKRSQTRRTRRASGSCSPADTRASEMTSRSGPSTRSAGRIAIPRRFTRKDSISCRSVSRRPSSVSGLTGLDFLWVRDLGRYQAPQWYAAIAQRPLGHGLDHPWFDRTNPLARAATLGGDVSSDGSYGVRHFDNRHFGDRWTSGDAEIDDLLRLFPGDTPLGLIMNAVPRYRPLLVP